MERKLKYQKMKRENRQDNIVAFGLMCLTLVVFVTVSNTLETNTVALILSLIAFLGGIFNLIYVLCNSTQKEKEFKKNEEQ